MESQTFDGMAESYDETRTWDPACFASAMEWLVDAFPPRSHPQVVEPGVGTGRIAIPLAQRGYAVSGVDVSEEMLAVLASRLDELGQAVSVEWQRGDAAALPYADAAFDMGIAVHLFYFIGAWRTAARELLRVVRPDGPVVLAHTGMGMELAGVNARYRELCAEQGCRPASPGVRSTAEVVDYYGEIGCSVMWIRDRWTWTQRIGLGTALGYVRARAYSFARIAPDPVHAAACTRLAAELLDEFGDLAHEVEVPNQIYLVVVRR